MCKFSLSVVVRLTFVGMGGEGKEGGKERG